MTHLGVWMASSLWSTGSAAARTAVRLGFLKPVRLNSKVISVGNLQAGGTGKTPLVARIAREASDRNLSVAVLTRGYRGEWERSGGVVAPSPSLAAVGVDPRQCGDEPALLHELCPKAWIGVGADRVRSYQEILKRAGGRIDCVILDDGFQHTRIHKDIEILAVTSCSFGERLFRDWPSAAKAADLAVWTKGGTRPKLPHLPSAKVHYKLPTPSNPGQKYWLVTGVADGDSVYRLALESKYSIVHHVSLADHFDYTLKEAREWMQKAAEERCQVALTGKDWVKWKALGVSEEQVVVLEPELEFEEGQEIWNKILWQ